MKYHLLVTLFFSSVLFFLGEESNANCKVVKQLLQTKILQSNTILKKASLMFPVLIKLPAGDIQSGGRCNDIRQNPSRESINCDHKYFLFNNNEECRNKNNH